VIARARLVGIDHVALEVGDIDEALEVYGRFFELTLHFGLELEEGRGCRAKLRAVMTLWRPRPSCCLQKSELHRRGNAQLGGKF
jgi:hypothetical protein